MSKEVIFKNRDLYYHLIHIVKISDLETFLKRTSGKRAEFNNNIPVRTPGKGYITTLTSTNGIGPLKIISSDKGLILDAYIFCSDPKDEQEVIDFWIEKLKSLLRRKK